MTRKVAKATPHGKIDSGKFSAYLSSSTLGNVFLSLKPAQIPLFWQSITFFSQAIRGHFRLKYRTFSAQSIGMARPVQNNRNPPLFFASEGNVVPARSKINTLSLQIMQKMKRGKSIMYTYSRQASASQLTAQAKWVAI